MDEHSKHIAVQAAAYFARRDETASQRREREAWLAEDARHARAYAEAQRLWDHMDDLQGDATLQAITDAGLATLRRSSWFGTGQMLLAAAALFLLSMAVWIYAGRSGGVSPATYVTQLGEHRTEVLADHSTVVLNTDSVVETRYTRNRRDVELQRGEAQFDVAHDASRPFVVRTDVGTITALGTRFQVRREPGTTLVTLLEGQVDVAHGEERRILRRNQQARLSSNGGIAVETIDPAQVSGWLDGWLRFRNTPLSEVVAEANRYSARKLRLGDPKLAGLLLSGSFHAGDSASIASAAEQLLPVKADQKDSEVVLQSK